MSYQISLFDIINNRKQFKIDKPIRLIELFAGYGSQHFALDYLGANFESWKICEWAIKSIQAYKDAHFSTDNNDYSKELTRDQVEEYLFNKGISSNYNDPMTLEQIKRLGEEKTRVIYNNIIATHNLVSVVNCKATDLEIVDRDKYTYMLTYSFPCQDLSKAGKLAGMGKGSGTRSGLLWEVERILEECNGNLPHVLIMENVPDVIGEKNKLEFAKWYQKLESLGYANFYKILNAKDYGIAQHRERCFMVSVLGDYYYIFPKQRKLEKRLKDFLEPHVNEKYFLSDDLISKVVSWKAHQKPFEKVLGNKSISPTLTARGAGEDHSGMILYSDTLEDTSNLQNECLKIKEATKKGYAEAYDGDSVYINRPEQKRGVVQKGMIQTIKTSPDVGVVVKDDIMPKLVGGIGEKKSNDGTQYYQQDRIYDSESIAMAHPANLPGGSYKYLVKDKLGNKILLHKGTKQLIETIQNCGLEKGKALNLDLYNRASYEESQTITQPHHNSQRLFDGLRIRKLTPKECFRLMGVKDQDFEKIAKNQSNSSLYHLAGDSIVVDVLKEIISMMLD